MIIRPMVLYEYNADYDAFRPKNVYLEVLEVLSSV
jgi:hypothetical protein